MEGKYRVSQKAILLCKKSPQIDSSFDKIFFLTCFLKEPTIFVDSIMFAFLCSTIKVYNAYYDTYDDTNVLFRAG